MALFVRTQGSKKSGGVSSETAAWNNYELRQILLDEIYLDPLTGDPKNEEYFKKTEENINLAIQQGLSEAKFVDAQKSLSDLRQKRLKFGVDNTEYLKTSLDELKADINDTWRQLWTTQGALQSGNFGVLAQAMEDILIEQREQVVQFRDELKGVTTDEKRIGDLNKLIDEYEKNERFYRGVYSNPQRYRLDISSNENGEVIDLKIRDKNSSLNGFLDTKQTTSDGLSVYGQPNRVFATDDGSDQFKIGGVKFSKLGDGFDVESDGQIDFSSFAIQDPTNSRPGDVLMSPTGVGYVKNQDGSYYKVRQSYAPQAGIDMKRSYSISSDEADAIERSFQVVDFQQQIDQQNQVRQQNRQELESLMSIAPNQSQQLYTPAPAEDQKPRFQSTGAPGPKASGNQEEKPSFTKTVSRIFSGKGVEDTLKNVGIIK